jgi:hypothetical protein
MTGRTACVYLCLCLIIVIVPLPTITQSIPSTTYSTHLTFTFSSPILQPCEYSQYLTPSLDEVSSFLLNPGEPILPLYTKTLTFPFGTTINKVTCSVSHLRWKPLFLKKIMPCPEPISADSSSEFTLPIENREIYSQWGFYPDTWYSYRTGAGIEDGQRVLSLTLGVCPLRYSPRLHLLRYATSVEITIDYETPARSLLPPTTVDMLVITPSAFSEALQPLVDHKSPSRVTRIVTLEEIPHMGRDIPEDIKLFIKQAIETWGTTNVLLVGGNNEIPVRMSYISEIRPDYPMPEPCFASDLYYADIYSANGSFSSWDTDNNNVFSEFKLLSFEPSDVIDLYPDIYLGRLPCTSIQEVRTCVNKTIHYEESDAYLQDWFSRLVVIGGDTFPEDFVSVDEGEMINQAIIDALETTNVEKLWVSNNKLNSAQSINDAINEGAGFVVFDGHATASYFLTHPHKNNSVWIPPEFYKLYHIQKLSNGDKLPIVTIQACHPCQFTVNHTCIGFGFLINPNGGSIATMGMASKSLIFPGILCKMGLGGLLHINCYQGYANHAVNTFGQMWAKTITYYLNHHPFRLTRYDYKIIESWEPFGDPSLIIRNSS